MRTCASRRVSETSVQKLVQKLVWKAGVEALPITVLPRTATLDLKRAKARGVGPSRGGRRKKLCTSTEINGHPFALRVTPDDVGDVRAAEL